MGKHPVRCALVVAAIQLLCVRSAAAATIQVLLASGDTAPDGRVLASFDSPIAGSAKRVAFLGPVSAIISKSGTTFTLVAKTGDALPAPLTGTFNSFNDPVINDGGAIAFRASLNSQNAESGVFLFDGVTMTPVVLFGGTSGGLVRVTNPPDLNNGSQVVYEDRDTAIYVWSGGTSTLLIAAGNPAPGGGSFTRFGARPVINASGVVAFEGETGGSNDGIFTGTTLSGAVAVARSGGASPIAGGTYKPFSPNQALSINAAGQVVFNSDISAASNTSGVFLYNPVGPTVTTVAQQGDLVGASALTGFDDEYVGIDSAGTVAFEGRASGRRLVRAAGGPLVDLSGTIPSGARDFAPRLTSLGRIIWRQGGAILRYDGAVSTVVDPTQTTPVGVGFSAREPSINNVDTAVFSGTHEVLYLLDKGTLDAVATPGDPSPGTGTLARVRALAYDGSSLLFSTSDGAGSVFLVRRKGALSKVLGTGAAAPVSIGGMLELDQDVFAVKGSTILFASSVAGGSVPSAIFRLNRKTGAVTDVVKEGDPGPGGTFFSSFEALAAAGSKPVFVAQLDIGARGLFVGTKKGPVPIVVEGDTAPVTGSPTFSDLGTFAAGARILFASALSDGTDGIFLAEGGTITKIVVTADPAPGGGTFLPVAGGGNVTSLALKGSDVAFVSALTGTTAIDGLFATHKGALGSVVLAGDASPLGGTIDSVDLQQPISIAGGRIILDATLSAGAGRALGLLAVKP